MTDTLPRGAVSMREGAIGAADQALLSALSFALALWLARHVPKEAFGEYGLVVAAIAFLSGIGNALAYSPLALSVARVPVDRRRASAAATGIGLLIVYAALLALALTVAATAGLVALGICTVIAAAGQLLLEFTRRWNFIEATKRAALAADGAYVVLVALVLAGFLATAAAVPTHLAALLATGLAAGTAGSVALYRQRLAWSQGREEWAGVLVEHWRHGRWALVGMLTSWLQTYAYAYGLAWLASTAAVADANVVRLAFAPFLLAHAGFAMVLLPRLAAGVTHGDYRSIAAAALRVQSVLALAIMGYAAVLYLAWPYLAEPVLGAGYVGLRALVPCWGAVQVLAVLRGSLSLQLQSLGAFRALALVGIVAAVLTLGALIPLTRTLGVPGAILCAAIGELFLLCSCAWLLSSQSSRAR